MTHESAERHLELLSNRGAHWKPMKAKAKGKPAKPFERFQRLIRGLVAVPKEEVKAEEARWRADRLSKKKSAGG